MDRPILFSSPMVRALIDGRKSQTRRIAKVKPIALRDITEWHAQPDGISRRAVFTRDQIAEPRYAVGDRLWVRETFKPVHSGDPSRGAIYRADIDRDQTAWKPGIHMPRWASRLTLTVTDVRIQQLQEISEADAKAEGVTAKLFGADHGLEYTRGYIALWNELNLSRGFGWVTNPWVVAVAFETVRGNIDQVAR